MFIKVGFGVFIGIFSGEAPSLLGVTIFEFHKGPVDFIVLFSIKVWKFIFEITVNL